MGKQLEDPLYLSTETNGGAAISGTDCRHSIGAKGIGWWVGYKHSEL